MKFLIVAVVLYVLMDSLQARSHHQSREPTYTPISLSDSQIVGLYKYFRMLRSTLSSAKLISAGFSGTGTDERTYKIEYADSVNTYIVVVVFNTSA